MTLMSQQRAIQKIRVARARSAIALDLSRLDLDSIPAELGLCDSLQVLDISGNRLGEIADAVCRLGQLRTLDASGNRIESLPRAFSALAALTALRLDGNSLADFPESLADLRLRSLRLDGNRIERLSESIGGLESLTSLNLAGNRLSELPASMGRLKSLETLNLSDNGLRDLPTEALRSLPKLKALLLGGNPGLGLPEETLRPPDDPEGTIWINLILDEFVNRRRREAKGGPFPRALTVGELKVVVLGQPTVNKSALVPRLIGRDPAPSAAREGFRVRRVAIPDWQVRSGRAEGSTRLDFWEFGGRDIFQAAHDLFLGPRSLAIVVLDGRGDDAERTLNYWVRLIRCHERGSAVPVLAVVVEGDREEVEIEERRLRIEFASNLRGIHRVSSTTDRGLADLKDAIGREVALFPFLREAKPLSFFALRARLEARFRSRRVVALSDLHDLCVELEIGPLERDDYVRLLGDLGMVRRLDDGDLVDAEWLAVGIAAVLNGPSVPDGREMVDSNAVDSLFSGSADYPTTEPGLLRELLLKFDLCHELPDSDGRTLVVPELLPTAEPEYEWSFSGALNLEFHYDVLPASILPRFIVKMHGNVPGQGVKSWRQGVILVFGENRALVRADLRRSRIQASVQGPPAGRASALGRVWDALDRINGKLPKLAVKVKLPLPDDPEALVDHEYMLRLESMKEESYLPPDKPNKYRIADILDGRRGPAFRKRRGDPSFVVTDPLPPEPPPVGIATFRISQVRLENVRNFEEVVLILDRDPEDDTRFETRDWVLLLGENGLGKTSVLRAIAAGLCEPSTALRLLSEVKGGLIRRGSTEPAVITIVLTNQAEKVRLVRRTEISGQGDKLSVTQTCDDDEPDDLTFVCAYGADRRGEGSRVREDYDVYTSVGGLFRNNLELQNPELVLRRVKDSGHGTARFFEKLERVLDLDPGSIQVEGPGLVVSMSDGGPFYPLYALGSGYQATLLWICDFLGWVLLHDPRSLSAEPSGIVLIDEIEQHLHPRWQRLIIRRLADAFPQVQFIASSHSAVCAGGLADLDEDKCLLLALDRKKGQEAVTCRPIAVPAGIRYDQIMTEEFGMSMAIDVTTEQILEEIRREVEGLEPGEVSAELDVAMEKLKKRSIRAFEDERMNQVQLKVASSLERIERLLEQRSTREDPLG